MRNDARPIGEDSPASPVGGDDDRRDSHRHDRQSHIVNKDAERPPQAPEVPAMPSSDSSLKTPIRRD